LKIQKKILQNNLKKLKDDEILSEEYSQQQEIYNIKLIAIKKEETEIKNEKDKLESEKKHLH